MDLTSGTDLPSASARMDSQNEPQHEEEPVRAVVADDDAFARRMIKEALTASGVVVIAEALNGREAVELTLFYRPDVVVMDVVMPELDGVAATRQIVKELPEQVVVLLTSSDE
jgi:two-component system, NarL family, response regulator LiaR